MMWISAVVMFIAFHTELCLSSAPLFQTKINTQYFPENYTLKIMFDTSRYKYSMYYVELLRSTEESLTCLETDDNPDWSGNVPEKHNTTECFIQDVIFSGNYCIRVTPLRRPEGGTCEIGCRTEWANATIKSKDSHAVNCQNWTASLRMDPTRKQSGVYSMNVFILIHSPFENCFNNVTVSLWFGSKVVCDKTSSHLVESTVVRIVPGYPSVADFHELSPGNYCVRLNARSPYCSDWCSPLYSGIQTLQSDEIKAEQHEQQYQALHISLYIIGIVAFLVLVILALHKKFRKTVQDDYHEQMRPHSPWNNLSDVAKSNASDLEIVLLYSRDSEEHLKVVESLHDFLLKCCGFKNIHFDLKEEAQIAMDLHSWVEDVTDVHINRRFLIVESEGGVLQEEGRKRIKVVKPVQEDYLDAVFPYAVQMLKNKIPLIWEHNILFVSKFPYTPDAMKLKCFVPDCRYKLPEHLFELYYSLLSLKNHTEQKYHMNDWKRFEEETIRKWKPFIDNNMKQHVNTVEKLVRDNPGFFKEAFFEEDIFNLA